MDPGRDEARMAAAAALLSPPEEEQPVVETSSASEASESDFWAAFQAEGEGEEEAEEGEVQSLRRENALLRAEVARLQSEVSYLKIGLEMLQDVLLVLSAGMPLLPFAVGAGSNSETEEFIHSTPPGGAEL